MSKGAGRVERIIRELIEAGRERWLAYLSTSTDALCRAVFGGEAPITKAQRVSVLRAMQRIMSKEAGWTSSRRAGHGRGGGPLQFIWRQPPEPPRPPRLKGKPQKAHEPIWAYVLDCGRYVWSRAAIISRDGADPDRITVEWNARKWQCTDLGGHILNRREIGRLGQVHPQFCHDHFVAEVKREQREWQRKFAAVTGHNAGVFAGALALLDLRRPFTQADVQRAFRTKSLKAHPDQGGDPDFFRALVHARDAALADADDPPGSM